MAKATKQQQGATAPAGARTLESLKESLVVNYMGAEELHGEKPFFLLNGTTRQGKNPNGGAQTECVFEILLDGGEVVVFTPVANAIRLKLVELLQGGPIGPVTLIQGEAKKGQNAPWIFGDAKGNPVV